MTVGVTYFQKDGFTFKPESISFGDGNSLEVKINCNGTINVILGVAEFKYELS